MNTKNLHYWTVGGGVFAAAFLTELMSNPQADKLIAPLAFLILKCTLAGITATAAGVHCLSLSPPKEDGQPPAVSKPAPPVG